MESQLNEALRASDARSTLGLESRSNGVPSTLKLTGDSVDTSAVTRKLEEELSKRDALIEVYFNYISLPFDGFPPTPLNYQDVSSTV